MGPSDGSSAPWREGQSRPGWLRLGAIVLALIVVLIAAAGFQASGASACPRPYVLDAGSCIDRDELVVLIHPPQTMAGLTVAIALYGGQFVGGVADAGIFVVLFPIDDVDALHVIERSLNTAGYEAFPNRHDGRLFATH